MDDALNKSTNFSRLFDEPSWTWTFSVCQSLWSKLVKTNVVISALNNFKFPQDKRTVLQWKNEKKLLLHAIILLCYTIISYMFHDLVFFNSMTRWWLSILSVCPKVPPFQLLFPCMQLGLLIWEKKAPFKKKFQYTWKFYSCWLKQGNNLINQLYKVDICWRQILSFTVEKGQCELAFLHSYYL